MKKSIFTLVFASAMIFANAQQGQNTYSQKLLKLISYSNNDFADVTGKMIAPYPDMEPAIIYACNEPVGTGNEMIVRNDSTGVAYYQLTVKVKDAPDLIEQTNLLIELIVQESKFTAKENKDEEGNPIITLIDKGEFETMITSVLADENGEETYSIIIFGKTLKELRKADSNDNEK